MKTCALFALLGLTTAVPAAFAATNVGYTATADPNLDPDRLDNTGASANVWALTYSGTGATFLGYGGILADGEIVPVPVPATVFGGLLLVGATGWSVRRRRRILLSANGK